jgi:mannose-6-phosphate isomerase-like protein (cupin superfamily)
MTIRKTGAVQTVWGTEIVWASNDNYCAKLLVFKDSGSKTSVQFHKQQHKSWFVNEGTFIIRWIDTETGGAKELPFKQGEVMDIPPLRPYQIESLLPGSVLFETGSVELENDTFRLTPAETAGTQS